VSKGRYQHSPPAQAENHERLINVERAGGDRRGGPADQRGEELQPGQTHLHPRREDATHDATQSLQHVSATPHRRRQHPECHAAEQDRGDQDEKLPQRGLAHLSRA
jgi:hypothetical protein